MSYRDHADAEQLERRIRELNANGATDPQIVARLRSEGYVTIKGGALRVSSVVSMRRAWGIEATRQTEGGSNPHRWSDGTYSVQGVAAAVEVNASTVRLWCRAHRIDATQLVPDGAWKIRLTNEELAQLRAGVRRIRRQQPRGGSM